jgi:hypothetical protein
VYLSVFTSVLSICPIGASVRLRCGDQRGWRHGRRREAEPGRVQPAQGLVERGHVADLGVVGEQCDHVAAQDVLDEPVQRLLRPDLDEDPGAGLVQRVQALHELHRGGHLPAEQVDERLDVRIRRVELAGHV